MNSRFEGLRSSKPSLTLRKYQSSSCPPRLSTDMIAPFWTNSRSAASITSSSTPASRKTSIVRWLKWAARGWIAVPACRSTRKLGTPCRPRQSAADSPTRLPPTTSTGISCGAASLATVGERLTRSGERFGGDRVPVGGHRPLVGERRVERRHRILGRDCVLPRLPQPGRDSPMVPHCSSDGLPAVALLLIRGENEEEASLADAGRSRERGRRGLAHGRRARRCSPRSNTDPALGDRVAAHRRLHALG